MQADFFTDDEIKVILNNLAKIGRVIAASSTEIHVTDIVDNAMAHAKNMVGSRRWTDDMGRDYVTTTTNAAAAYYAMRRNVSEYEIRNMLIDVLFSISGMINKRIGFDLLPASP